MSEPRVVIREPGRTALHLLISDSLEVGRDCKGLLLNDPQISRVHLELKRVGPQIMVTDLDSTNGTTLDGVPLAGPTHLAGGSVIRLGDTTIELFERIDSNTTIAAKGGSLTDLRRTSILKVADAVAREPAPYAPPKDQSTVTIVFSDIESSTQRAQELGDERWFALLSTHNTIVRRQVALHHGSEIKAQGDGFMLTFPSARGALRCMIAVQQALTQHNTARPDQNISVRVGVHTGEAIAQEGDLFGSHVNLAARVADQAAGGEILASSLVKEIVAPRGDISFAEPRTAELKGLAGSHTLYPVSFEHDANA